MGIKKPRKKKCKACGEVFQPERQLINWCSTDCAIKLVNINQEKKKNKEHRERKADLKPISHWLNMTQAVFNQYIRLRDAIDPCISCGRLDAPEWAAGHYRTRGAASQLRFNEDNVHKQCNYHCNQQLSGNIAGYRPRLIAKIGQEKVDILENDNTSKIWTREELSELRKDLRNRINNLSDNNGYV